MNLILLHPSDFVAPGRARLVGRRLAHVREVHRAALGQRLLVGLVNGKVGSGAVVALDGEGCELAVVLDRDPPPKLPLTVVCALPRPKVVNRLVAQAAALGVARLVLLNAWRVDKGYWGNQRLHPAHLGAQLELGLEQAKDTVLPELWLRRLFVPFVEDELPALVAEVTALVAHPAARAPVPRAVPGPMLIALGPEGGFIAEELASLERAGLQPVSLGPRVLRTETALATLIGRLT